MKIYFNIYFVRKISLDNKSLHMPIIIYLIQITKLYIQYSFYLLIA